MGVLITAILLIFQPFGLYGFSSIVHKALIAAGYGLITFLIVTLNGLLVPAVFPSVYVAERWTVGKSLLLEGAVNFCLIGLVNWLYSVRVFAFSITLNTFLFFELATICVGLLPYIIVVFYNHIVLLRKNIQEAEDLNENMLQYQQPEPPQTAATIRILGDSENDSLELAPSSFLFASAADNYVKIRYRDGDVVSSRMMRMTLKKLSEYFSDHAHIIRCHRTYLVNIHHVSSFSGNAQGLKLKLRDSPDAEIAVSRAMVPVIKNLLADT